LGLSLLIMYAVTTIKHVKLPITCGTSVSATEYRPPEPE
jgi:hypothetical protein